MADNASFLKRFSTISLSSLFCRAYLLFCDEVVNLAVTADIISTTVKSVECLKCGKLNILITLAHLSSLFLLSSDSRPNIF